MLGKRKPQGLVAPLKKKRKPTSAIDEIAFDPSAREDYLTGFHKRKLQRIKNAKEEAAKQQRADKLAARKILRENRKADLEKHVETVNSMLRDAGDYTAQSSDSEQAVDGDSWDGIYDAPTVDHDEEYVDEDRFTSVTVEAVDVTRDGLHKIAGKDDEEEGDTREGPVDAPKGREANLTTKKVWTKERPQGPKKKKKKFRYESKAERKVTRYKERSGGKAKAKERRT